MRNVATPLSDGDSELWAAAQSAYREARFDEATHLCERLIPSLSAQAGSEAHLLAVIHLLGMIAGRTGRTALGINLLREVVSLDAQSVDARRELGILLRKDGQAAEAIGVCRQLVGLRPQEADAHDDLGLSYLAERRFQEAAGSFAKAVELQSERAIFHYHLGIAQQRQGQDVEAADSYRAAIMRAPSLADAHARLGHILLVHGKSDEAIAGFQKALEIPQDSAQSLAELAQVFAEAGQTAFAADCLRKGVQLDPDSPDLQMQLGTLLQQSGRFTEALMCFEKVVALQPHRTRAYLGIVSVQKVQASERPFVQRMLDVLAEPALTEADRANLHYALGKAFDDLGDYGEAIRHFDEGNGIAARRLRASGRAINCLQHAKNIDRIISTFNRSYFARHALLGSPSELPILIVGMIRSGTTLAEQIISSHPEIGAAGELRFWSERSALQGNAADDSLAAAATALAEDYISLLHAVAPEARRVTDKMPTNFFLLGLIHLMFPQARIIHCRRNPVDTCLSIYVTPFDNLPDFAHDRSNIVFYYEQYLRLMAHWRRTLPADRFFEVDYEDLVADRERVTREIISFCGLDWSDACLHPEANDRVIKTPSSWQARQPVYNNSVARWRRYEKWLGPFARLMA